LEKYTSNPKSDKTGGFVKIVNTDETNVILHSYIMTFLAFIMVREDDQEKT